MKRLGAWCTCHVSMCHHIRFAVFVAPWQRCPHAFVNIGTQQPHEQFFPLVVFASLQVTWLAKRTEAGGARMQRSRLLTAGVGKTMRVITSAGVCTRLARPSRSLCPARASVRAESAKQHFVPNFQRPTTTPTSPCYTWSHQLDEQDTTIANDVGTTD